MRKLFIFTLLGFFSIAQAEVRNWTQAASGREIAAEFVEMKDDDTVTIKMSNGRSFDVPVASLSEEDQAYIKKKVEEMAPPAEESGKTDAKKPTGSGAKAPALPEGEVTVTLSGVHLCCKDCEEAVLKLKENKDVYVEEEVEVKADRKEGTVTIKAPNGMAAQAALKSMVDIGYYGESDHEVLKIPDAKGKGSDFKSNIMTVKDLHLCCKGCTKEVETALKSVSGVEEFTVEPGATKFIVKGTDISPYAVMTALRAAGFGGTWQ